MPSLSLDLDSHECTPDENGNQHRMSIDALSSKRHKNVTTFKAQVYSHINNDPRHRVFVIVKVPRLIGSDSYSWAQCQLQKAQLARDVAAKFNNFVYNVCLIKPQEAQTLTERKVFILKPQVAVLDSTSVLARKMKKGDCFVCEDIIHGLSNFIDEDGIAVSECVPSKSKKSMRCSAKEKTVATKSTNAVSRPILIPPEKSCRRDSLSSTMSDSPPSYEESNYIESFKQCRSLSLSSQTSNDSENNFFSRFHNHVQPQASTQDHHSDNVYPMLGRAFETTRAMSEKSNCEDDGMIPHPLLQAFVHFFFYQTEGRNIVCNLKGSLVDGKYSLTTPVIHSVQNYEFGERDDGLEAVESVIDNHRCTWLCRQLPDMTTLMKEALRS